VKAKEFNSLLDSTALRTFKNSPLHLLSSDNYKVVVISPFFLKTKSPKIFYLHFTRKLRKALSFL